MATKAEKIIKRFEAKVSQRSNWEDHWRQVLDLVMPRKRDIWQHISGTVTPGEKKHRKVYDSSAEHYVEVLASALHTTLTNQSTEWFELTSGDPEIDKKPEVKAWLQKLVKKIHRLLNNSNFHEQIHEVYLDLVAIGTGAILVEEDKDLVVRFKARPIFEFYIEENHNGEVDAFYTPLHLTVRQAFSKYGMEAFGDEAVKLAKDLDKKVEIIHAVMPRSDVKLNKLGAKGKPFASYHVYRDKQMIVQEKGFDTFPGAFPR